MSYESSEKKLSIRFGSPKRWIGLIDKTGIWKQPLTIERSECIADRRRPYAGVVLDGDRRMLVTSQRVLDELSDVFVSGLPVAEVGMEQGGFPDRVRFLHQPLPPIL